MKVTIVELPDDETAFEVAWQQLCAHTGANSSELVVLNEVPFAAWFGGVPEFDASVWSRVVDAHERWHERLGELGATAVLSTAPTGIDDRRNAAVLWTPAGTTRLRDKVLLPDEEPVWEASWYDAGTVGPTVFEVAAARAAVMICSELWAPGWASDLGRAGTQLIATPRATGVESLDNWFAAGRVAAISAGAFSVSSNRVGAGFGGGGWIFGPNGAFLARTSAAEPFVTVDIDLDEADRAKSTYPRYVTWGTRS